MKEYWKKYWKIAAAAVFLTAAGVVFWLSGEMGGEPLPAVSSETAESAVLEGTVHDGADSENPSSDNPML